jgi:diguanylate cyclase (GGDEF)-like protein
MPRTRSTLLTYAAIVVVVAVVQFVSSELDLFDWFYDFLRAHEDWEIDEIVTSIVVAAFGLLMALIVRSRELRLALIARDRAEQEALVMSRQDALTGLPNRRGLQHHFDELSARSEREAVPDVFTLLIDLDRFKVVNDLHGHDYGDAILKLASERMRAVLEPGDFAARLGGDEFAIAVRSGATNARAESLARNLIRHLERPFEVDNIVVLMGASIGLSRCKPKKLHDAALKLADQALYAAKRAGRGQLAWYDAELGAQTAGRVALEADLRQAVQAQAIVPYFQPIVETDSGRVTGFEVLARWTDPERGEVPPSVFIKAAEDIGIIRELGLSVLAQACISAQDWDACLGLSINISPQQFRDSMVVTNIRKVLSETGFDPKRLEIEVTEAAIIGDFEWAQKTIAALQALGISVALDDFGTGYCGLSSLRRLPFNRIKIDRSFVTDIANNPENQKILSGIMSLAQGLDLSVTAEGVETKTDLDFLISIQCDTGQGYWFEQPLPASRTAWMLDTKWSALTTRTEIVEACSLPQKPSQVNGHR